MVKIMHKTQFLLKTPIAILIVIILISMSFSSATSFSTHFEMTDSETNYFDDITTCLKENLKQEKENGR